jgi:hypothetical protein
MSINCCARKKQQQHHAGLPSFSLLPTVSKAVCCNLGLPAAAEQASHSTKQQALHAAVLQ